MASHRSLGAVCAQLYNTQGRSLEETARAVGLDSTMTARILDCMGITLRGGDSNGFARAVTGEVDRCIAPGCTQAPMRTPSGYSPAGCYGHTKILLGLIAPS